MKTSGLLLKEAREAAGVSLEALAKRTNIREEYLEAIERNAYSELPGGPFTRGFLRTYASEVGLNPENVVAIYRRDFGTKYDPEFVPKGFLNPVRRKNKVLINPFALGLIIVALVVGFFAYMQWRILSQPPRLQVLEPLDGQSVTSPVLVRGSTTTDAVIMVNQTPIAIDQDGNFTTQIDLTAGDQTIVIEARTRKEKSTVVSRSINVIQ